MFKGIKSAGLMFDRRRGCIHQDCLTLFRGSMVLCGLWFLASFLGFGQAPDGTNVATRPYADYRLPIEERVQDLVSRLTLEEKISLLSETARAIPRLGITEYHYGNEALHGVVRPGQFTVFPQSIGLASTWDPDLVHEIASAISDEARGKYNADHGKMETGGRYGGLYNGLLTFWSPTINMARDPRWGRTAETYGEDPYLTSRLAVAFIKGLQGDDPHYLKVVATPKHFAMYNEEFDRFEARAVASQKAIYEYYLPAFRAAIKEGHAESIMSSYNAINGVPSTANHWLLTDLLRNDWGFHGYVVTDCGATVNLLEKFHLAKTPEDASALAINAGVDLECEGLFQRGLQKVDADGIVTSPTIDRAVSNVLRSRFRLGMFDPPAVVPYSNISAEVIGSPEHEKLALRAAEESLVLLKNDAVKGNPLLPLDGKKVKTIAVVGPYAALAQLGDYSGIPIHPAVTPIDGLRSMAGQSIKITQVDYLRPSVGVGALPIPSSCLKPAGGSPGDHGLIGEYFPSSTLSGEPSKRIDAQVSFDWFNTAPDPLVRPGTAFSVIWKGALVSPMGGKYKLVVTADDAVRLTLDGKTLIDVPVAPASSNLADAAKPAKEYEAKVYLRAGKEYSLRMEYRTTGGSVVRLGWFPPSLRPGQSFAREVQAAKASDVAFAFVGFGTDAGMEGKDRENLDLSSDQQELIQELVAVNPNTIVVLISGGPLAIEWISEHVPALVEAWYPGEQGGTAIANLIFGALNPAGRLPLTFYRSNGQLPDFKDYEVSHGRTYQYLQGRPLFPFGFGLSYSKFTYSNLKLTRETAKNGDVINASFDLTNTSTRDGDEVAQLYFHTLKQQSDAPIRQLAAFRRVNVLKGKTARVSLQLPRDAISTFDSATKQFADEVGQVVVEVGASSADIRLRDTITLNQLQ